MFYCCHRRRCVFALIRKYHCERSTYGINDDANTDVNNYILHRVAEWARQSSLNSFDNVLIWCWTVPKTYCLLWKHSHQLSGCPHLMPWYEMLICTTNFQCGLNRTRDTALSEFVIWLREFGTSGNRWPVAIKSREQAHPCVCAHDWMDSWQWIFVSGCAMCIHYNARHTQI